MRKPRVRLLKDDYAISTGEFWCCSFAGVCARGKEPFEAFKALRTHFEELRKYRAVPTMTRMF